jgi:threonine/homoserine/homoserine lactone efflux protein
MLLDRRLQPSLPSNFRRRTTIAAFRQGVFTNVLNPKVALFFLAFLPQFIDPASNMKLLAFLALGLTFVTTGTIWCHAFGRNETMSAPIPTLSRPRVLI